jgi:hypothetical protein
LRSAISHGGEKAVLDAELKQLRQLAIALMMRMIQRSDEFGSRKDLLDSIEWKKLGG